MELLESLMMTLRRASPTSLATSSGQSTSSSPSLSSSVFSEPGWSTPITEFSEKLMFSGNSLGQTSWIEQDYFHSSSSFRASLWWKYLDHNTVLPPPFTVIYLLYSASRPCWKNVQFTKEYFTQDSGLYDRKDFYKRYKRLLLTLVRNQDNSWGYSTKKSRKSMKSMLDCGGD